MGGGETLEVCMKAGLIVHSCSPNRAWLVLLFRFILWEEEAALWTVLGVYDWET